MLEPLSLEYLTALSSCPLDEINQLLCSSTELNQQLQKQAVEAGEKPYDYDYYYNDDDNGLSEDQLPQPQEQPPHEDIDTDASSLLVARITTSQAIAYLNMIVSRSPSFQFTNNASNTTSVLPASSSHPPPPPPLPPVQLLTNIRNVATILAHSQQRYSISSSGILVQLQTCLLLNGFNPILYIHFLECCLLAGQYHYARKYMDLHTHECDSSSSSSSLSKSNSGTVYPHIIGSIPGGEKSEYSPTVIFARYHYLRGMVLYACEELSCAIVEWSHCLTMPYNNSGIIVKSGGGGGGGGKSGRNVNNGVNEIVCAAWKKWVLAKCLLLCQYGDDDECDNKGGDDEMVSRGGKEEQEKQQEEEEEDGGGEEGVIVRGGNVGGVVEQKRVKEVMEEEEEEEVERMTTAMISSKMKNRYVANGRVKKSILTLPRGTSTVVSRLLSQGRRRQQGKGSTAATGPGGGGPGGGGTSTAALNDCLEQDVERYQWLVDEFLNGDLEKLLHPKRQNDNDKKLAMLQSLERDGNVGMIKQLLSVVRWRTLRKISKIYSTITISQLSRMLDMEPMECMEFLLQVALKQQQQQQQPQPQKDLLLQKREYRTPIEFRVDGGEMGVVYFEEQDVEEEEIVYLEEKLRKTMALANRIKDLDVSLASSSRYQMNLWKHAEEGKRGGKVRGGESGRSVIDLS